LKLEQVVRRYWIARALIVGLSCSLANLQAASSDSTGTLGLPQLLQQAKQFEDTGQWTKALEVYEQIPARERNLTEVADRFQNCLRRIHQAHRHHDSTYRDQILKQSWYDALEIYGEVLAKLQTNYVDREKVEVAKLFRQGLEELRIALFDAAFCDKHLPGTKLEVVRAFQEELRSYWNNQRVSRPRDAQDQALLVAWSAEEQLGLRKTVVLFEFICGACSGAPWRA